MKISIPEEARIIILEGIAGSGKTTYKGYLLDHLQSKMVYEYTEQELVLGWKHIHIQGMSAVRLTFFEVFLDELEKNLKQKPDAIFILERFHLSLKVLEWEFDDDFDFRYQRILNRLRKLPVHIIIAKIENEEIKKRMHHRERSRQWSEFVEEKLILRGFEDLELLSIEQQKAYFEAAEEQGIPYELIHVELDH